MKNLVIFDVDGTLISQQTQKILLDVLRANGIVRTFDYLWLTVWFVAYKLRILRNTDQVRRLAYMKLAGLSASQLDAVIDRNFESFAKYMLPQAYEIVQKHKEAGDELLVISASIEPIVTRICQEFNIDDYICTKLEIRNGLLTGDIVGDALYGNVKLAAIGDYIHTYTDDYEKIICYADHISDLPMLEMADIPICVNPDARLAKIANSNHWQVLNWV